MWKKFDEFSTSKLVVVLIVPVIILKLVLNFLPLLPLIEDILFFGAVIWVLYVLIKFLKKSE